MTKEEILKLSESAEQTCAQLFDKRSGKAERKKRVTREHKHDVSCEMTDLSNLHSCMILVRINDKTASVNPLLYVRVHEITNLQGSMVSVGMVQQIMIETEMVAVEGGNLVACTINDGLNKPKPYHGSKCVVSLKQGSDKRKVFDNIKLSEMMSQRGCFAPDEVAVNDFAMNDLDEHVVMRFLLNRFAFVMEKSGVSEVNMRDYTLPKDQFDIVIFCSIPKSAKEILERKGLYNQSRARKKYIQAFRNGCVGNGHS